MAITLTLVENDIKGFQQPMEVEMTKAIKHLENELVKIRTGRAHTSLVEDLPVAAYGQMPVPLKNLAVLAAPDVRLITIQPWDKNLIGDIERAIKASDVGLTPINDGDMIRLRLPEMSSTRRDELVKILGKKVEECRVAIRNIRKDFNNFIRDAKKDKVISENFFNRLSDVLQKVTDTFIEKAEQLATKKEKEISTV
ncbi:MAG TPA: ribosome recycling factor [Candidatus Babeliales bacterium]|jgi:ribosome recycling factor|nr:ribosome recycling factor [Candidatus Babeliales bacterium]